MPVVAVICSGHRWTTCDGISEWTDCEGLWQQPIFFTNEAKSSAVLSHLSKYVNAADWVEKKKKKNPNMTIILSVERNAGYRTAN